MAPHYYRLSIRFSKPENKRRLNVLQKEMSEKAGKKVSISSLVENIVEQFLDKNVFALESFEEKDESALARKRR